jgi:hypothetical protein
LRALKAVIISSKGNYTTAININIDIDIDINIIIDVIIFMDGDMTVMMTTASARALPGAL